MEHIIIESRSDSASWECLVCGSAELAGEYPGEYQDSDFPDYPPPRDGDWDTEDEEEPEELVQRGLFR